MGGPAFDYRSWAIRRRKARRDVFVEVVQLKTY